MNITHPITLHMMKFGGGDKDLEWMFLSSCEVLKEETSYRWIPAFNNKLHGICGFHSIAVDVDDLGKFFAIFLTDYNWTIGRSWLEATIITQPSQWGVENIKAAILCGVNPGRQINFFDERLPGSLYY